MQISRILHLFNPWQYEVAAHMSQNGCVTLPGDVLSKVYADQELVDDEKKCMPAIPQLLPGCW